MKNQCKSWSLLAAVTLLGMLGACGSDLSPSVKKDINATVATRHDKMQECYEDALERDSNASGKVTLRFAVNEGEFSRAKVVKSAVKDRAFSRCVAAQTATLKLKKKNEGKVVVTYRLAFKPER